jgi:hypothetical protein
MATVKQVVLLDTQSSEGTRDKGPSADVKDMKRQWVGEKMGAK